jgi:hypothetical protein
MNEGKRTNLIRLANRCYTEISGLSEEEFHRIAAALVDHNEQALQELLRENELDA